MSKKNYTGRKRLLDYLGASYGMKYTEGLKCMFLEMRDHNIEIDGGYTARSPFDINVWKKGGEGMRIIERYKGVEPDLPAIKDLLDGIRNKYEY